jgi:hypothetical protein
MLKFSHYRVIGYQHGSFQKVSIFKDAHTSLVICSTKIFVYNVQWDDLATRRPRQASTRAGARRTGQRSCTAIVDCLPLPGYLALLFYSSLYSHDLNEEKIFLHR